MTPPFNVWLDRRGVHFNMSDEEVEEDEEEDVEVEAEVDLGRALW